MTKLEQAARQLLDCFEGGLIDINSIIALREALAEQAEQEPVAWGWVMDGEVNDCIGPTEHARCEGEYTLPLYATPVRTKYLTDDEIAELPNFDGVPIGKRQRIGFARAVIAKDREKNK